MKNNSQGTPFIQTFLTGSLKYNEGIIAGIKVENVSTEDNEKAGFFFEECGVIENEFWGDVYLFGKFAYVCADYQWIRFDYEEYLIKCN